MVMAWYDTGWYAMSGGTLSKRNQAEQDWEKTKETIDAVSTRFIVGV